MRGSNSRRTFGSGVFDRVIIHVVVLLPQRNLGNPFKIGIHTFKHLFSCNSSFLSLGSTRILESEPNDEIFNRFSNYLFSR